MHGTEVRARIFVICAALLVALTGCYSQEQIIQDKARVVQACVDSGGQWYNTPGWGENCNFDTRGNK